MTTRYNNAAGGDWRLLTGSVSVVPGVTYGVQLKLMMGDLNSISEYADLSLDGQSTGRCGNSSNSLSSRSCDWLPCDSGLSDLTSANSSVSISIQYNNGYDYSLSGPCTVNGTSGVYAAAILTLSPKGIFWIVCIQSQFSLLSLNVCKYLWKEELLLLWLLLSLLWLSMFFLN